MHSSVRNAIAQASSQYKATTTNRWFGSPLEWLANIRDPVTRGTQGKEVIRQVFDANGLVCTSSPLHNTLEHQGVFLRTKTCVVWDDNRALKFQQIRDDQPYDILVMLGVTPDDIFIWLAPKDPAIAQSSKQHAEESRHANFRLTTKPSWLYGGDPSVAVQDLKTLVKAVRIVKGLP